MQTFIRTHIGADTIALRIFVRAFGLLALAAGSLLVSERAIAQAEGQGSSAGETMTFAIPAQPLADALDAFIARTGWQVGYAAELAAGKTANAVQGEYTPEQALVELLAGSGLTTRFTGAETVTLEREVVPQPGRLSPITVTAARGVERSISAIPGGVQVIDRGDLADTVPNSTGDISRTLDRLIPGANFEETLDRSNLILRGRRVQIQLNGVPTDQKFEDLGRELHVIDPALLESIEVVRSANAANGVGAPGGVINLIPRRPEPGELTFRTSTGVRFSPALIGRSIAPTALQSVSYGEEELDFIGAASWERRNFQVDGEGDVIPVRGVGSTAANVFSGTGRLGLNHTPDQRTEIGAAVHYYRQHSPFFVPVGGQRAVQKPDAVQAADEGIGQFMLGTDPDTVDPVDNLNMTFDLQHTLSNLWGGEVTSKTYYQRNDFTVFGTRNDTDDKVGQRFTYDVDPGLPIITNVALGFDAEYSKYTSEDSRTGEALNPPADQFRYGAFSQVDAAFGDLFLTGGFRLERIEQTVGPFFSSTPQDRIENEEDAEFEAAVFNIGAVFNLTDRFEVFGGFSQGYDVPQISDAAGRVDNTVVDFSSTAFEPVETDSYEVGFRYFGERFSGSVTGYFNESDLDVVVDCPNPGVQRCVLLRQPSQFWGVELTGEFRATENLTIGGVAAYNDGIIKENGDSRRATAIDVTPPSFTLYVDSRLRNWWQLRGDVRYVGENDGERASFLPTYDSYVTVDLLSEFTLPVGTLTVGAANLFDEFYVPARRQAFAAGFLQTPGPGRTVSLTYSITW